MLQNIFFIMSGLRAKTVHMGYIIISHAGAQAHAKEKKMQKKEITEITDEVKAPVKKGDTVGRICYRISGKEIGSVNLIASTPVEKADFGDYLKKIWKKLL